MRINETDKMKGLYTIEYNTFYDNRGTLFKPFSHAEYVGNDLKNLDFKEVWFTRSKVNVIRGMHYQSGERACGKLVTCLKGRVLDVVLDLRNASETYGQYHSMYLSEDRPIALYIPIHCAHGYRVEEDDSIVMYMATDVHDPAHDIGVRWDCFGFNWGIDHPILSEKDRNLPQLT